MVFFLVVTSWCLSALSVWFFTIVFIGCIYPARVWCLASEFLGSVEFCILKFFLNSVLLLQKMVNGGKVSNWICINFSRNVQDSVAKGFCYELAQMCHISGMVRDLFLFFYSFVGLSYIAFFVFGI